MESAKGNLTIEHNIRFCKGIQSIIRELHTPLRMHTFKGIQEKTLQDSQAKGPTKEQVIATSSRSWNIDKGRI